MNDYGYFRSHKPGYFTLKEIKAMDVPGWPRSISGLRKKAFREGWPRSGRRPSKGGGYEYKAGVTPD